MNGNLMRAAKLIRDAREPIEYEAEARCGDLTSVPTELPSNAAAWRMIGRGQPRD